MNKCIHKYKDQACGYFGTDPGCDKTMEDCVAHENEHRIHIHPHPPKESETGTAWQFVQPHPSGGNCLVSMTEEQAIKWMQDSHAERMYSREDALADFITIHWATKKKET